MPDEASETEAREFAEAFRGFLDWIDTFPRGEERNEVVALIAGFLGAEGMVHSVVTRELPPLEHVNLQTALDAWCARPGRAVDIRGIAVPPHFEPPNLQQLVDPTTLPAGGLPMDAGARMMRARRGAISFRTG
jgi:cell division protease FtsH